ncbi:hypothetical protein BAE44_0008971 [Dichanthelium oligosanthes]|uniref:Uncharacterized protein n=1 Tax=Dichanthelium oligosanthes TaxID=888268 RepID=A0A1E5VY26_9POAL|nr:hypothetical protein BAE44_0008971 [Dichanthelium oligosanthes]
MIRVIPGNVIFGPPPQKYWAEKQQQEAGLPVLQLLLLCSGFTSSASR